MDQSSLGEEGATKRAPADFGVVLELADEIALCGFVQRTMSPLSTSLIIDDEMK